MSSFTEDLIVKALSSERHGRGLFAVHEPFHYDVGFKGNEADRVTIPVGFVTDFASIPWFARAFIPVSGRVSKPALIHDRLLEADPRPKREIDRIFCEAMEVAGISKFMRTIMYLAVRTQKRNPPLP